MTSQLHLARPKPAAAWPMYRAMVGIGLLCGLVIVSVFQWTRPIIQRNRAEALSKAIFEVLPEARSSAAFRLTDAGSFVAAGEDAAGPALVYAGYDDAGRLVGLAVEAAGMGYQDVIRVLYGYSFADDAIVGLQVLESKETPGLGDKIETDPDFLENFRQLDVGLTGGGEALAHPIRPVKHGGKVEPWEVDGITGATISSKAIARMLDESAGYWIPRIRRSLSDFQRAQNGGPG